MARACTVCIHSNRAEIDQLLVEGSPIRAIASRFGLSRPALDRHKAGHLPETLAQSTAAAEVSRGDALLSRLRELSRETTAVLRDCRAQAGNPAFQMVALKAIERLERQLVMEHHLLIAWEEAMRADDDLGSGRGSSGPTLIIETYSIAWVFRSSRNRCR